VLTLANLPNLRFHDLRHTAASLMLNCNIPVIVVSRILGHSKPSVTLDVYAHVMTTMQEESARVMDDLVSPVELQLERTQTAIVTGP
jgi:integrase